MMQNLNVQLNTRVNTNSLSPRITYLKICGMPRTQGTWDQCRADPTIRSPLHYTDPKPFGLYSERICSGPLPALQGPLRKVKNWRPSPSPISRSSGGHTEHIAVPVPLPSEWISVLTGENLPISGVCEVSSPAPMSPSVPVLPRGAHLNSTLHKPVKYELGPRTKRARTRIGIPT